MRAENLDCTDACRFVLAVAVSFADGFWPKACSYRGKGKDVGRIRWVDEVQVQVRVPLEYVEVALQVIFIDAWGPSLPAV